MKTVVLIFCLASIALLGCTSVQTNGSTALNGTWHGPETGRPNAGDCYLIIHGGALSFKAADPREWYQATFTLRPGAKPPQLVAVITDCSQPQYIGKTANAIYDLNHDQLTLTANEPGNPDFPASFDAPQTRKLVFQRQP